MSAGGTANAQGTEQVSIAVTLQPDGDATVTVTNRVSLLQAADRSAFDALAANETAKRRLLARTVGAYAQVANGSEQRLERSMTVESGSISLRREGSVGFITVRFRWTGFARSRDGRLVVGDVFTGGFPLGRNETLRIRKPDGYRLAEHNVSTQRASVVNGTVSWEGPVTITPSISLVYERHTPTPTPPATSTAAGTTAETATETAAETTTGTSPGFGAEVAVLAVLTAAVLARRRT